MASEASVRGVVVFPNGSASTAILQCDDQTLLAVRIVDEGRLHFMDLVSWLAAQPGEIGTLFNNSTGEMLTIEVLRVAENLTWDDRVAVLGIRNTSMPLPPLAGKSSPGTEPFDPELLDY